MRSKIHYSPFTFTPSKTCLESKIRTCNLPRPRRVNNHRYLSSFSGSVSNFFAGRQPELKFSVNLAVYAGIEPAVPKRQSGRLAFTSIDLFCNSERDRTSNLQFRKPTLYPIELQNCFVIPEGIEPSTPGLKDRCSDQLSYEIVFLCEWLIVNLLCLPILNSLFTIDHSFLPKFIIPIHFGYLRGSNPVLRFHRPTLYHIS